MWLGRLRADHGSGLLLLTRDTGRRLCFHEPRAFLALLLFFPSLDLFRLPPQCLLMLLVARRGGLRLWRRGGGEGKVIASMNVGGCRGG